MAKKESKHLVQSKFQTMPLAKVAKISAGHSFRSGIEHDPTGSVSVVQLKNVDPFLGLDSSELPRVVLGGRKGPTYLEVGDILFVNRGLRFFAAMVDSPLEKTVASPHFLVVKAKSEYVLPEYLVWFLNCKQAQRYYAQCAAGTALPHVSRRILEALPVALPSLEKQFLIARLRRCAVREKKLSQRIFDRREQLLFEVLDAASQETN